MQSIFIDESGDFGRGNSSTRWFVLAMICISNKRLLEHAVKKVRKSLQAVDFIAWSIFRKYEHGDEKFYELIKPRAA